MSQITFEKPSAKDPGYLRRTRSALEFLEGLKKDQSPQMVDRMIDFLLPFVKNPEDRNLAREALLDASEDQFNQLLAMVSGSAPNPTSETPIPSVTS
jgi:hypothetical protein